MQTDLEEIARTDGRFSPGALRFVYEGLGYLKAKKKLPSEPVHVSGRDLCHALKDLAIEKWGMLALLVLGSWGVKSTRDFGEIVYLMIEHKWMSAQPADSIEDFDNVYDFKTVFKKAEF